MKSIGHFINGKEISGKSDRRGKVFNPATGEVQAEVAYADKELHFKEQYFIKQIADILNIERHDLIKSKLEIEKYL